MQKNSLHHHPSSSFPGATRVPCPQLRIRSHQSLSGTGLKPVTMLDPGSVVRVEGRAFASGGREVQEMPLMVASATAAVQGRLPGVAVDVQQVVETPQTASGMGSGVTLVAVTDTGCRLGATAFRDPKQRLSPQQCGQQVVEALLTQLQDGGCVDRFLQDQLVIFMALAVGRSAIRIGPVTDHTTFAIATAESLLPCKFEVQPDGQTNILICLGAGLTAPGRFMHPGSAPTADEAPPPPPSASQEPSGPAARAPIPAQQAPTGGSLPARTSIADRWTAAYGQTSPPSAGSGAAGHKGGKGGGKGSQGKGCSRHAPTD
eukprot:GGOE01042688.1.p2 GENE.GGOE01042688.1~~GGOE01042688.1.p2  ORF type:complete len:317 (-),score=44.42 GGOE01042688.1:124-1074(-)